VLARGLEANPTSAALWLEYVDQYSRLPEVKDVAHWARMATTHAPGFKTWWKVGTDIY